MTTPVAEVADALPRFGDLLEHRLALGVFTTEDSVRYSFFAALLEHGIAPSRVVLEWPHPAIPGAEVDTMVADEEGSPTSVVEFKYDRAGPGGATQPRPQKAGAAFADIKRLAVVATPQDRYFVYLVDLELARYLVSPRNGLHEVFELGAGRSIVLDSLYFASRSPTFLGRMGDWPGQVTLESVLVRELPSEHCLRVYSVATTDDGSL